MRVNCFWFYSFLYRSHSTSTSDRLSSYLPLGRNQAGDLVRLAAARERKVSSSGSISEKKRKQKKKQGSGTSIKSPRLLVFDLDGCLWKPELFELLACRDGAPFSNDPSDTIPGTCMLSRNGEKVELLGDARLILYELYSQEQWYPSRVGISSRTDPPEWAHELMAQFSIYNPDVTASQAVTCSMKEVFDRSLCILDKTLDKAKQFEMLLEQANSNNVSNTNNKSKKLKFKDIIFFDNEAGNCKQVARLGVTCVYTPRGLTYEAWENGLRNFPANRVLGPKAPY